MDPNKQLHADRFNPQAPAFQPGEQQYPVSSTQQGWEQQIAGSGDHYYQQQQGGHGEVDSYGQPSSGYGYQQFPYHGEAYQNQQQYDGHPQLHQSPEQRQHQHHQTEDYNAYQQRRGQQQRSHHEHNPRLTHPSYDSSHWRQTNSPSQPSMRQLSPQESNANTSDGSFQRQTQSQPKQSIKHQATLTASEPVQVVLPSQAIAQENGKAPKNEATETSKRLDSEAFTNWETEASVGSEKVGERKEVVQGDGRIRFSSDAEDFSTLDVGAGAVMENVTVDKAEASIEELKGKYAKLKEPDPRPHLNVVFIGHVDAGKSTTCGNILFLTGQVDQRTIEKYEREAKEKNRDTWFFAFITDVNEEERQKGKTVEVGRAVFELENTRFTILDAPGHKSFVPNMISGAAQADVAVLIISARKGEFETGFERGGQTREHAMLAKTLGVSQVVVAVNKMDDPTCGWSEERYREIEKKLTPFLKGCGYNAAKDVSFVPISGLSGQNLKLHATDSSFKQAKEASWYDISKPTLFSILNNLQPPERNEKDFLRIPLLEGFRDQGVMAVGKVEAGIVTAGQGAILMPKRLKVQIAGVQIGDEDVSRAKPGENVTLKIVGVDEEQITKGMVLCSVNSPCPVVTTFKAQVMIVELLEHRPLMTAGYSCVIHAHTACEEVQLTKLLEVVDKATKKRKMNPPFVKGNSLVVCEMQTVLPICVEVFEERPQLGRFTLRDEGKTIAIGKVLEIIS